MTINNIVVISDIHAGCKYGLCPPDKIKMDEGGYYVASSLQNKVWSWWEEFWGEFVPDATRGEPYAVVFNGDALDGNHHGSVTQISHNLKDQATIAEMILKPVVAACEGRFFHIRGTEAHVGQSGQEEERLSKSLGAIPNADGQYARFDLWLKCGLRTVNFAHHIGTSGSLSYEASALNRELTEMFVEAARWGYEPPDVIVRAHRHKAIAVAIPTRNRQAICFTTPAWQLKTPFCYKIAGARNATPQIGGSLVRFAHDRIFADHFTRNITMPEPEVVECP